MAEPFATSADVEKRYRVEYIDEDDADRLDVLLGAASRLIRNKVPGIVARIQQDSDFGDLVTDIACEMVWLAISAPTPGVTQETRSVGSVSVSATFDGAAGRVRLTRAQLETLRPARARARAGSVSSLPPTVTVPLTRGVYVDGRYVGPWTGPSPNPGIYTG